MKPLRILIKPVVLYHRIRSEHMRISSLEGKTILVVEVERLDKSKPLGDAKIPLDVKEKELVSWVSLESSNWLKENLPFG